MYEAGVHMKAGTIWRTAARLVGACCVTLWIAAFPDYTWTQIKQDALVKGFEHPPRQARLRCYWWWLNGHTTKATITHDLEEMAKKGYGGALLVDANGADQGGNDDVPAGPEFGSPAWTALYVHALKEADRLGLEITLNITSGWNLGGPDVKPEQASKLLTWSQTTVPAGGTTVIQLKMPPIQRDFYRQIAVLAYPLHDGVAMPGESGSQRSALTDLKHKNASEEMGYSMPDATSLLTDATPKKKDADSDVRDVVDITKQVDADGTVHWKVPSQGPAWEILRIGYTASDARVSTSSGAWQGLAIDYLDPTAFDLYWKTTVEPLLVVAKPYVGKSLKYVATDSWELGGTNWTRAFREEFKRRRGYDPVPYLPVVAGRILGSREISTQFLTDLRRTVGDLVNTHYDRMAERAKAFGLGTQCESGGPHGAPLDGLETFRSSAMPQTEYWAMSKEHRSSTEDRYFAKEGASAAHIYGRRFAADEGMTSIGNQWSESLGENLRPSFDQALTEGMNRLVWHEFTSSPPELGLPGQEYFAGTHLNPNVTWWNHAAPFFAYLNRSQFLLQQGLPVSDLLYYYGDNVPNFVRLKQDDPAKVLPGFDYDVTDSEVLLNRLSIVGGVLRTPEGITYKALTLPEARLFPLAELMRMDQYVHAGGTIIGLRPLGPQGIVTETDQQRFAATVDRLWSACEASVGHHVAVGKGQLYCTDNAHDALLSMGVLPDFATVESGADVLDYVHRRDGSDDIYFVRNTSDAPLERRVLFRATAGQLELFHADTGVVQQSLMHAPTGDGRTMVPISLGPHESIFVVFHHGAAGTHVTEIERDGASVYRAGVSIGSLPEISISRQSDGLHLITRVAGTYRVTLSDGATSMASMPVANTLPVTGPWTLRFPAGWGTPAETQLQQLGSWTESGDAGIRYFSGTATYSTVMNLTAEQVKTVASSELYLGDVHEVAGVRINGMDAGIAWKRPYVVRAGTLLHPGENRIEIEVTNLWPNRLIGDAQDVAGKRYTWTNVRKYTKDSPLLPSGLIGPVEVVPVYDLILSPHDAVVRTTKRRFAIDSEHYRESARHQIQVP
jgi:hypothetical protein